MELENPKVKTRFLILSDTHGAITSELTEKEQEMLDAIAGDDSVLYRLDSKMAFRKPLPKADVVLHCGDLTGHSKVYEFQRTFQMIRDIDAPLKLVIAGNHDGLLDPAYIQMMTQRTSIFRVSDPAAVLRDADEVRAICDDAKGDGVQYLEEGTHQFDLPNGARLRIFASPCTPKHGSGGFQYEGGHDFAMEQGIDVAMTHGPAQGVLDLTKRREGAGSDDLFERLYTVRPKLHCFGHIHEAWGAKLVTWKDAGLEPVEVETAVDDEKSLVLGDLASVLPERADSTEEAVARIQKMNKMILEGGAVVNLCEGGDSVLVPGKQTLFVNAAIRDAGHQPGHLPWLVDLELPKAESQG
jgi:hypothetical protein